MLFVFESLVIFVLAYEHIHLKKKDVKIEPKDIMIGFMEFKQEHKPKEINYMLFLCLR